MLPEISVQGLADTQFHPDPETEQCVSVRAETHRMQPVKYGPRQETETNHKECFGLFPCDYLRFKIKTGVNKP